MKSRLVRYYNLARILFSFNQILQLLDEWLPAICFAFFVAIRQANSWLHTCALVIVDHEELNGGWHVVHSQISQQNRNLRMWFFAIRFSLAVKKALSGCKVCTYWLHQMVWKLQWYPLEQSLATAKNLLSGIGRFNCCPSSTRRNLKPMSLR